MSVVQKARDLFLTEDERTYRKAGLKDACGNWTDEARQIYLEQLMNQDKTVLPPIAEKIVAEQKSEAK